MMQGEHKQRIVLPSSSISASLSQAPVKERRLSSSPQIAPMSTHCTPSSSEMISSTMALNSSPATNMSMIKHDEHIARVTLQAYQDLDRLSQIAQVAAASASASSSSSSSSSSYPSTRSSLIVSPRQHQSPKTRSRTGAQHTINGSSSLFINKSKIKPKSSRLLKRKELESLLDRNQNLLKSREVIRLLKGPQLDKLRNDTKGMERQLEAIKQRERDGSLEDTMMKLGIDGKEEYQIKDRFAMQVPRGKARMISVEENARLQKATFEAEQEMQRTKEYELMGKQMTNLDLSRTRDDMLHCKQDKREGCRAAREDDDDTSLLSRHHSEIDVAALNAGNDDYEWF